MKTPQLPRLSIITVVYNGVHTIERTISSVQRQSYKEIEHIIIDGGSTDGTVELIKKHSGGITTWICEPDRGVYDAMNKGLEMATGEYVWFINAGDEIYSADTLENIRDLLRIRSDVYYGEAMYTDMRGEKIGVRSEVTPHTLPDQLGWQDMNRGQVVCHQSFLVKRDISPRYDLRFPHSGDIDWMIRCLKISTKTIHTGTVLSKYLIGGHSKKFHLRSLIDRYRVLQQHFGVIPNIMNHAIITVRALKHSGKKNR
jgi:glycosyltransferase involved in cell wall biosynthesis